MIGQDSETANVRKKLCSVRGASKYFLLSVEGAKNAAIIEPV
jgi:hypothetical protein